MCQQCLDIAKKHYPQLNDCDIAELLISGTCFPFGTPEQVEEQLIHAKSVTDGSLGAALSLADTEMDEAMIKFRRDEDGRCGKWTRR